VLGRSLAIGISLLCWVGAALAGSRLAIPAYLVELPTSHVLLRGDTELDFRLRARQTDAGVYSNLQRATFVAQEVDLRVGFSPGVEFTLMGTLSELSVTPVEEPFRPSGGGMPVAGASVKFRVPDRILGCHLAFGLGGSVVASDYRALFQPEEFARFAPFFAVLSCPILPELEAELVFRRGRVLCTDENPGTNLTTFALGLEWTPQGWLRFQLEVLSERLSIRPIGDYGESIGYDGMTLNAGVAVDLDSGSYVQLFGRRLNRSNDSEVGLAYGWRP
jgi:hypothetical protein